MTWMDQAQDILRQDALDSEAVAQAKAELEVAKARVQKAEQHQERNRTKVENFWWKHEKDFPQGLKEFRSSLGKVKLNRFDEVQYPPELEERLWKMRGARKLVKCTFECDGETATALGLIKEKKLKLKKKAPDKTLMMRGFTEIADRAGVVVKQGRSVTYTAVSSPSSDKAVARGNGG